MESAGSSPLSSDGHGDSLGRDYDMESANATPASLFAGAADSDMPHDSTSASPRHAVVLPTRSSAPITQRALPQRDVSEENIVDAYAAFILYCNPYFPLDIDTSDLRRIFQTPPRSDGKDFSIFTLWQLVQRFDSKEIKTWTQLALELGVEPPSAERGGSVQKVQQYSVRLKVSFIVFPSFQVSAATHTYFSAGCVQCMSTPSSSICSGRSTLTTWIFLRHTTLILREVEMVSRLTRILPSGHWILRSAPREVAREMRRLRKIRLLPRSLCLQRPFLTKEEFFMLSPRHPTPRLQFL
jgi:hypothetical protein